MSISTDDLGESQCWMILGLKIRPQASVARNRIELESFELLCVCQQIHLVCFARL